MDIWNIPDVEDPQWLNAKYLKCLLASNMLQHSISCKYVPEMIYCNICNIKSIYDFSNIVTTQILKDIFICL